MAHREKGVTKSKDGRVRKADVGNRYDSEQGTREFRIVEWPARECVRLMNLEDTTLFDEIKTDPDASQVILLRIQSFSVRLSILAPTPDSTSAVLRVLAMVLLKLEMLRTSYR